MKDQVRDTFNGMANAYEHSIDSNNLYNAEYERPAMLARLPADLTGRKVLDAGCAAGWYTEQLLHRGAEVVAVDMSPEMVNAAIRRVGDSAKVLCLDLEAPMPFGDETFDVIVSSLTLHYLKDWQDTFTEFRRVLKPGGLILFSVHHPLTDIRLLEDPVYLSTELIVDKWVKDGKTYTVPFYRRPLNEILNGTLEHFELRQVIEPLPTGAFKERDPERFERLMKEPNFLIVEAARKK
ncbi:class I SAM-dependent methyltransferase [Planococcus salinarum]|uniref:class I SAM-dependent methyltransferase n=1 Tax=Planococcus salinarum TaxID=622695 RepID=UPI000E3E86E9|nr:class I SAM-dependent methyltransferase [Planococcus salinarum]TAA71677.1 class I SAM-dependent methyltransferase [Planococcus salinarum]